VNEGGFFMRMNLKWIRAKFMTQINLHFLSRTTTSSTTVQPQAAVQLTSAAIVQPSLRQAPARTDTAALAVQQGMFQQWAKQPM